MPKAKTATVSSSNDALINWLCLTVVGMVSGDHPDLSCRQLAIFLHCYLTDTPQTVRGLAAHLAVSKPAISRALDRLSEFDLAKRVPDPLDLRSVNVKRTAKGQAYLRGLSQLPRRARGAAL